MNEIDGAVGELRDGARGGAGRDTAGIGTVHALEFRHQPGGSAVRFDFVELDQVPEIRREIRHRLIAAVEGAESVFLIVPFLAGNLAGFAADA